MQVQPTQRLLGYVASRRHRPGTTGTGAARSTIRTGRCRGRRAAHYWAAGRPLLYSGVPATGTVLSVVDVKVPRLLRATVPAGATIADLTLRVSPPDGASYEVRTRIGFSSQHKRSVVAVEGATLPIRVDPLDAGKVAVDTVALGFAPEVRHR